MKNDTVYFLGGKVHLEQSNFCLKFAVHSVQNVSTEHKVHNLSASSLVYNFYGNFELSRLTLDIFLREWVNWKGLIYVVMLG